MSGEVALYDQLSGREVIDLSLSLRSGNHSRRAEELKEVFKLPLSRKVKTYSSGQKQQLALIVALAPESELLILDEPTNGLDPSKKKLFLKQILRRGQEGATIIISSHILSEIESICTRVGFIRDGKLLEQNEIEAVRKRLSNLIVVSFVREIAIEKLESIAGVESVIRKDKDYLLRLNGDHCSVLRLLADFPILSLSYQKTSLDELYDHLYLKDLEGKR